MAMNPDQQLALENGFTVEHNIGHKYDNDRQLLPSDADPLSSIITCNFPQGSRSICNEMQ